MRHWARLTGDGPGDPAGAFAADSVGLEVRPAAARLDGFAVTGTSMAVVTERLRWREADAIAVAQQHARAVAGAERLIQGLDGRFGRGGASGQVSWRAAGPRA